MSERKIKVTYPGDQVRVMFGAGDEYKFLATGNDTDGEYFLVEAIVPPGGGPPPHIQTLEEEAFYILDGELTFYGDDGEIVAGPGTFLNIPKGARHQFRNNSNKVAKMLFFFSPSGIENLFDAFEKMDQPTDDFSSVIAGMNKLAEKYGVQYFAE